MTIDDKLALAVLTGKELLKKHKLEGWRITLSTKRKHLADTYFNLKKIEYSIAFVTVATRQQFEGVMLHEIAHARLGPGYGHGKEFVKMCKQINAPPMYAGHKLKVHVHRYNLTCPECGFVLHIISKHILNKLKNRVCTNCLEKYNKHTPATRFVLTNNVLEVRRW